jgi:hypothetical protein
MIGSAYAADMHTIDTARAIPLIIFFFISSPVRRSDKRPSLVMEAGCADLHTAGPASMCPPGGTA